MEERETRKWPHKKRKSMVHKTKWW